LLQGGIFSASTGFSSLLILPAQAKGPAAADSTSSADSDQDAAKCPPGSNAGASSSPPRAHHHSSYSGEGSLGRMALDLSNLNLTDDQKSKITAIRGRNAAHAKDLRQSLATKGGEYRNLLFSVSGTNEQIMAKHDEISSIKEELESLRLNDLLAIRAVLNTDQRKKLAETKPFERRPGQHGPGGPDNDGDRDRSDRSVSTSSTAATSSAAAQTTLVKAK